MFTNAHETTSFPPRMFRSIGLPPGSNVAEQPALSDGMSGVTFLKPPTTPEAAPAQVHSDAVDVEVRVVDE